MLEETSRYQKKLGTYRPKFQGKPEDYYTLTVCSCFGIVVIFFWITVALFYWSNNASTSNLILFCSILLCVFIPSFIIFAYIGSNNKMEVEEKLIKDALNRIIAKKDKTSKRYDQNANLQNSMQVFSKDIQ